MAKLLKTDRPSKVGQPLKRGPKMRKPSNANSFSLGRRRNKNGIDATITGNILHLGKSTGPFSLGINAPWDDIDTELFEVKRDFQKSSLLIDYRSRVERMFADCRLTGRPIDVFAIRDALFAQDVLVANSPNVRELVDRWIAYDNERLAIGEIVQRTHWKNRRWTNDFWAFTVQKYGYQARLTDYKAADIKEFVRWLRQPPRELSNNVAQSTASHAKVLLNYALDNEWINRNVFVNFRRSMDPVERVTLTEEEIRNFCTFPLANTSLETVRDVFFFMCLSGLSFSDIERLGREHIKSEMDGEKFIHLFRRKMLSRKSRTPATIPLTPSALSILAKYEPSIINGRLLPLQANAPFNRSLKQIAFMCGLDKSVSTKVARNSLATYLVNNGVPLQSVSAMLGHSSTLTTQTFYTKVSPGKVISDLNDLYNRLNGNGLFGIQALQSGSDDVSRPPTNPQL
jgi:site-specific recombinase XerD